MMRSLSESLMSVGFLGRRYSVSHAFIRISTYGCRIVIKGVHRGSIGLPWQVSCSSHIATGLPIRVELMCPLPEVVHVIQQLTQQFAGTNFQK